MHLLNILLLFVPLILAVLHRSETKIVDKDESDENIDVILVTLDVSQADRSKVFRLVQLKNIDLISVTFDVSKPERSKLVIDLQPWNI